MGFTTTVTKEISQKPSRSTSREHGAKARNTHLMQKTKMIGMACGTWMAAATWPRWKTGAGGGKALTKGKGGGKTLTKGKGKGKGNMLAIEDGDPDEEDKEEKTEEEQWKELLQKAKRARDQCNSARADCEAALDAAEKAKRVTKAGKKDTEDLLQKLATKVEVMKQLLANKDKAMKLERGKTLGGYWGCAQASEG